VKGNIVPVSNIQLWALRAYYLLIAAGTASLPTSSAVMTSWICVDSRLISAAFCKEPRMPLTMISSSYSLELDAGAA
jgi:hypothetical protein